MKYSIYIWYMLGETLGVWPDSLGFRIEPKLAMHPGEYYFHIL